MTSIMWPEEEGKKTSFYFHRKIRKGSKELVLSEQPYHLTVLNSDKNGKIPSNGKKQPRTKLVLYHAETKEIVDSMYTDDIIGAELEITFEDSNSSNALEDVGVKNTKAKERANEMEKYEKQLGKKLIGGSILEDSNLNLDEHVKDDTSEQESEDGTTKNSKSRCTSAAYLNIFCYPRRLPAPKLSTIIKNCYQKDSSPNMGTVQSYSQLTQDDVDNTEFDESQMGHRYEKHRRYKLFPTEDFSNAQLLIPAIRNVARIGHFEQHLPPQSVDEDTIIHDIDSNKNPTTGDDDTSTSTNPTTTEKRKHFLKLSHEDSKTNLCPKISTGLRRKKFLVIVNPFSGKKEGEKVYHTMINKMLRECSVDHDVLITQHPGHAFDQMKKKDDKDNNDTDESCYDVSTYDAVIVVGGDGILSEIINGLRTRDDFDVIMERLQFGIVGCGTCNGLAASLLHNANEKYGVLESIFQICKGQSSKIDLSLYQTKNNSCLGFLTFTWAMIADIDIESECLRFLGVLRNDIWGAWRVLKLKTYKARFSYLPAVTDTVGGADGSCVTTKECPDISDDLTSDWITIEDDFILFWASQVTHAAHNVLQSPKSSLQDGVFQIWIVRNPCSKVDLVGMLIQMENGHHVSYKSAEFYECHAFRLEPLEKGSFNDVDGEVVESGIIQSHILPSKMDLFVGRV